MRRQQRGLLLLLAVLPGLPAPAAAAAGFGGRVLGATPRNSVGSPAAFPANSRRDLALQDDGSVWVADPTSRFVTVFAPGLGERSTLELDAAIPVAAPESPAGGVAGLAAVPGDPGRSNHILVRLPAPRIALVAPDGRLLALTSPFRGIAGVPTDAFLSGLDRHPSEDELVTLDEVHRRALLLDLDYRVLRGVDLLGDGNPLSGAGIAYRDGASFVCGAAFGRPFSLDLLLEYGRPSGLYSGFATSLDSVPGVIAGGFDLGVFAGETAVYFYNVPQDQVVAVAARRVSAPPPVEVTTTLIAGGEGRQLRFRVDPNYGIDEVVARENGVQLLPAFSPAGELQLLGLVGATALELETRSGGIASPIALPLHFFNGDWIAADDPGERFRALPFDPQAPDFDPRDELTGLALDWQGTRAASRLYLASRRSRTIRILTGDGKVVGSFAHGYLSPGVAGLALAPERDRDGRAALLLLDADGIEPPVGAGLPRWVKIDQGGGLLAEGTIDASLLGPPSPGAVAFGDWDADGRGGYVVFDGVSGKACRIDGGSMRVETAVPVPSGFLSPAGAPRLPGGAVAVLPSGLLLLSGGSPGSSLATELHLLSGLTAAGGAGFSGFSLAVPDLSLFRVRFCAAASGLGCPEVQLNLPGVGFAGVLGIEAAYEESSGLEIAYFVTPDAVLFEYFDGTETRPSEVGTQGLLTRTGARSRPDLDAEALLDEALAIPEGGAAATRAAEPRLALDAEARYYLAVGNPGDRELRVLVRLALDGALDRPALRAEVAIPPGRVFRREAPGPGSLRAAVHLGDLSGSGATARILLGVLGRRSAEPRFRRGDADGGGEADITDAVMVIGHLFLGAEAPACPDAADADDVGGLDITDPVALLQHLFLGGPEPPAPGIRTCGTDPTADALARCEYGACG